MWEHKTGNGRWKNYVNSETGEQSIKNHELKLVKTWCAEHRLPEIVPANRLVNCLDCGQEVKYIVGIHNRPKKS